MYLAQELVSDGGPSAPVWAFFTAISIALVTLLGQQLAAKREARQTREETIRARKSAEKAQQNTSNVSNGFAGRVDSHFETLIRAQQDTSDNVRKLQTAFQKHLEWHLEKESKNG